MIRIDAVCVAGQGWSRLVIKDRGDLWIYLVETNGDQVPTIHSRYGRR